MKNMELNSKFDVVTCIFSAIHYNRNCKELETTLTNFYSHLKTANLIFNLSLNHENWIQGLVSVDTVVEEI